MSLIIEVYRKFYYFLGFFEILRFKRNGQNADFSIEFKFSGIEMSFETFMEKFSILILGKFEFENPDLLILIPLLAFSDGLDLGSKRSHIYFESCSSVEEML